MTQAKTNMGLRHWLSGLLAVCLALGSAVTTAFDEGIDYRRVVPAQPTSAPAGKIEVVELFWYACPHCYQLEPHLDRWKESLPEDVVFVRLPAIFSPRWEPLARAYYAAELLGVVDRVHKPLFEAIHDKRRNLNDPANLAAFFEEHDVSREEFQRIWNSFGLTARVNRARELSQRYGVQSVPTLIVNGKYYTQGGLTGSHAATLQVVDHLIERERAAAQASR